MNLVNEIYVKSFLYVLHNELNLSSSLQVWRIERNVTLVDEIYVILFLYIS